MTHRYRKLILAGGDFLMMYLALTGALFLRGVADPVQFWMERVLAFSLLQGIWIVILYIDGFYEMRRLRIGLSLLQGLIRFVLFAGLTGVAFFYAFNVFGITPKTVLLLHILIFVALFVFWRWLAGIAFRSEGWRAPVVLLERDGEAGALAAGLTDDPYGAFRVAAICRLGDESLCRTVWESQAGTVIVTERAWPELPNEAYDLALGGVRVVDAGTFLEEHQRRVDPKGKDMAWFLTGFHDSGKREYETVKRLTESAGALAIGIASLPLQLMIAAAIRISSPGPVLFIQRRIGQHGREFSLVKFRTMTADAEKDGPKWAEKSDARITALGRILRHTHLDELPQVWNVIRGEMSMIGPRPEQPHFVEELKAQIPYYGLRHLVRPGITGWAQTNYRYGASVDDAREKLAYDLWYVKRRSAAVDLKILLRTIAMLFRGEGR